jgi:predicted DNA-binding transcriptional regulator YafY
MNYPSSSTPHPERREIDPFALVHRWGWWYAIAFCQLRQEMRTFRVDRMESISLRDQVFSIPPDFDIQAYLANEWKAQPQISVQMRFAPEAAHLAHANRAYWDSLTDEPGGSVLVTLSVPDIHWAAANALAYGPSVTVLAPEELRQMAAKWAREIAEKYERET